REYVTGKFRTGKAEKDQRQKYPGQRKRLQPGGMIVAASPKRFARVQYAVDKKRAPGQRQQGKNQEVIIDCAGMMIFIRSIALKMMFDNEFIKEQDSMFPKHRAIPDRCYRQR